MPTIEFLYGKSRIPFYFDEKRFRVLAPDSGGRGADQARQLSDVEVGDSLDAAIESPALEEIVGADETVLIIVPDATRPAAAAGQIVNLIVRRLIAGGMMPGNIRIIFATGI